MRRSNKIESLSQQRGCLRYSVGLSPSIYNQLNIHNSTKVPLPNIPGRHRAPHMCTSKGGRTGSHRRGITLETVEVVPVSLAPWLLWLSLRPQSTWLKQER